MYPKYISGIDLYPCSFKAYETHKSLSWNDIGEIIPALPLIVSFTLPDTFLRTLPCTGNVWVWVLYVCAPNRHDDRRNWTSTLNLDSFADMAGHFDRTLDNRLYAPKYLYQ